MVSTYEVGMHMESKRWKTCKTQMGQAIQMQEEEEEEEEEERSSVIVS